MSEESTTPDLTERVRGAVAAANSRDFDAGMSFYAPDAVWDTSPTGLGVYEGQAAIRSFFEDWFGSYEELALETETILDLGNGVVYTVNDQHARLAGSTGVVRLRDAWICDFVEGLCVRVTVYPDIDKARAAAERLAEERGWAMSQENVEIATRAIDAWNRCDLAAFLQEWHPACEWRPAFPKGTEGTGSVFRGHAGITTAWRAVRVAWTVYRLDVDEARSVGDELLVLGHIFARGATSGIELRSPWSAIVRLRDERLMSAWDWLSHEEALEAVGLAE